MSGWIRRGLKFSLRGAFGAFGLVAGCGELLGIDDPPAPSECVKPSDCGRGRTCVEWKCVDVCSGPGCAGGGGEAGEPTMSGTAGNAAGEAGTPTNAGGAGGAPAGAGGESGGAGEAGESGSAGAGHTGGEAGESPGGAGGEGGGSTVQTECTPGDSRCLVCEDGHYVAGTECEVACSEADGCIIPKSCSGLVARCGPNESCCKSLPVSGGEFSRSCDLKCQECDTTPRDYPATISHFALDAYEVTVARFRTFVLQYPSGRPQAHSGKNPHNAADEGWRSEWDALLPATREELELSITDDPSSETDSCGGFGTWTATPELNEAKPINCVSFYLAYAFCIWDGGRLPTEAEWNYAAAGGDEQRVYPWSSPASSSQIDAERAVFGQPEDYPSGPLDVGSLPAGNGRFGHSDLAGNLAEWVLDDHATCYPTPDRCNDCGYSSVGSTRVLRGGHFGSDASGVLVESRLAVDEPYIFTGFRCVRDL